MKTPILLRQVEAYWECLRTYGDIPNREQIDPRGIEEALNYAFILEVSPSGEPVFRLSGNRLGDLLGMPLERVPLTALFARECQTQVRNALLNVFTSPGILRADVSSKPTMLGPEVSGKLLILPLRHDDRSISRALGVLYYIGNIGKAPRLFDHFTQHTTRIVLNQPESLLASSRETMGLAEAPSLFEHKKGRPESSKRPILKVIKGGRP